MLFEVMLLLLIALDLQVVAFTVAPVCKYIRLVYIQAQFNSTR